MNLQLLKIINFRPFGFFKMRDEKLVWPEFWHNIQQTIGCRRLGRLCGRVCRTLPKVCREFDLADKITIFVDSAKSAADSARSADRLFTFRKALPQPLSANTLLPPFLADSAEKCPPNFLSANPNPFFGRQKTTTS